MNHLTIALPDLPLLPFIGKDAGQDAPIVTRELHVKAINEASRTVDFVASTDSIDAHDEIVDQGSWILDDYLKNPVCLFAHNSRELPIGRSVDVAVRSGPRGAQLECKIEFATEDLNPKAEQVFRMLQQKYLRAVSVGFIPRSYRFEMRNGQEVLVWSECVLKEISVVPVPANGEALAKMKAKALEARNATNQASHPMAQHSCCSEDNPHVVRADAPLPEANGQGHWVEQLCEHESTNDRDGGPENNVMNEKEMLAKVEDLTAKNSALAIEAGAANGRADKAEKSLGEIEPKVKALETENAALKAQTKALADERDAATKRADELEAKTIDQEVDALIGKKISPAEKPLFVDLRKQNKDLFEKMIAQRADMKLEVSVTESGAAKNGIAAVAGDTAALLADVKKAANLG